MSATCKKYFSKEFKENIWTQFLQAIKKAKDYEKFENFLNKYLTPREKTMLEKRLAIFYLLEKGLSYRKISRELAVTLRTISFVRRGFKKPSKRIIKKEENHKPLFSRKYKGARSII